jgi:adenylate cyclase
VGVGLHYGDASYGNMGAPTRLDFTVIGPAVNLASRIEGLCSKLGARSVLASQDFIQRDVEEEAWDLLGDYDVKGVSKPVSVYELAVVASAKN